MLETQRQRRTPYIGQSEASECALACLAMVANFHGLRTDLVALRQRFSLSLKGATLVQIMQIAEALGFNARPLRLQMDELGHIPLPAILHWNFHHFVVITKISRSLRGSLRYHIHDPARGVLVLGQEELSRQFTGVALELLKSGSFQPQVELTKLRISQLWSSITGLWATLRNIVLLSLVLQAAALVSPFYMQLAVDTVFPSFDRDFLRMLALGFASLALITFVTGWVRSLLLVTLSNTLSYQIVVNLFRHLLRLPLPWFEKRHVGDVISRFGSTKPITDLLSQGMIAAFIDGVMASATLVLMFVYSTTLALIALAALAMYVALRITFRQALRLSNLNVITANAKENSLFIETMRGMAAIKAFGQEGNRQRLWQRAKADAVNAQIRLGRMSTGFEAANQLLMAVERVVFVYLAISMALDGGMTVGMIFAFQAYKQQFLDASTRLVEQGVNYSILQMHLGRVADIALSKAEPLGLDSIVGDDTELPTIELRNVRFSYAPGEPEILKGVSLKIEPKQSIVFIGPSGGGKTTLLKIMMGLFAPSYGEVLIGGVPLRAYGLARWRSEIGLLAQDDTLFAGSIEDNISFFDPEANLGRVREVARVAGVAEEIDTFPMQYATLVGDMGSSLSGGQRQRILLARALYRRPKVLFTDEGTANLDPENEARVLRGLASLPLTQVTAAHRGSVAASAERIFVVANGQVVEGTLKAPSKAVS